MSDTHNLILWLNEEDVPYLLIGGYALMLKSSDRHTEDMDIILPKDATVITKIKKILKKIPNGEQLLNEIEQDEEGFAKLFENGDNFRLFSSFPIDIMFQACGLPYEELLKYSEEHNINGVAYKTLNEKGLFLTKSLSDRPQDIRDKIFLKDKIKNRFKEYPETDKNGNVFFVKYEEKASFLKKIFSKKSL